MRRFDGKDLKALVIEDNEHFRLLVRTVLHSLEIREVREASDGLEALEILRTFPADFVLLDWKMEPMDGISFTLKIRRSVESPNPYVPIIMVTAHSDAALVRDARDAGVNEFLAKPLSANDLISRIVSIVTRPRQFVRCDTYMGPDRRRQNLPFPGPDRRRGRE